jgi:hypothetical protein
MQERCGQSQVVTLRQLPLQKLYPSHHCYSRFQLSASELLLRKRKREKEREREGERERERERERDA